MRFQFCSMVLLAIAVSGCSKSKIESEEKFERALRSCWDSDKYKDRYIVSNASLKILERSVFLHSTKCKNYNFRINKNVFRDKISNCSDGKEEIFIDEIELIPLKVKNNEISNILIVDFQSKNCFVDNIE